MERRVITLSGGRTFTIRHPERVTCGERGRNWQVNTREGLVSKADLSSPEGEPGAMKIWPCL
jgi:hypothetical protein